MREIKFRLWNKRENKMVYLPDNGENELLAIGLHGLPIAIDRSSFDRKDEITGWNVNHIYDVMQYTGLKDRNFHEIYEGDIIRFECLNRVYSVECTNGGWNPFIDNMHTDGSYHYAIIGNIYENPDLLKEIE